MQLQINTKRSARGYASSYRASQRDFSR